MLIVSRCLVPAGACRVWPRQLCSGLRDWGGPSFSVCSSSDECKMSNQNNDAAILSAVTQSVLSDVKLRAPTPKPRIAKTWSLPGFFGKCRIMTSFGKLPIEALRKRDPVKTLSGEYLEVTWVDKIQLDEDFLLHHPQAQPVFIPRNGLGSLQPETNMLVSPAQRLKEPGRVGREALKPASELVGRTSATRLPHSGFTYYVFHCEKPAVINVEGIWFHVAP
ncbi:hypothetical protein C1J05_15690 [Sulfitobacter sp. JL08]|nr:hypothetical protein C1J05_15690 [Sulfitobacter sp. JL08]